MASYIEPLGLCDFCSKPFYENDFRLKQISNECANVFKLEFCGIDCLQAVEKDYMFVRLYEFQKTNEYNCVNEDEYNIIGAFLMNHRSFAFVCEKEEEKTNPSSNTISTLELTSTPIYNNSEPKNKNKIDLDSDYICLDFEDSTSKSSSIPRIRKTYDVINKYLTLKKSNIETLTKEQKKFLEFCDKHKLIK
jgi:hypothetical protein